MSNYQYITCPYCNRRFRAGFPYNVDLHRHTCLADCKWCGKTFKIIWEHRGFPIQMIFKPGYAKNMVKMPDGTIRYRRSY
jgi:hypothetical protein